MISLKPFGSIGRIRPWASARHRSRSGLMETLRRDYGGDPARALASDALNNIPAPARRELRDRNDRGDA